jgi:hypothetical protein
MGPAIHPTHASERCRSVIAKKNLLRSDHRLENGRNRNFDMAACMRLVGAQNSHFSPGLTTTDNFMNNTWNEGNRSTSRVLCDSGAFTATPAAGVSGVSLAAASTVDAGRAGGGPLTNGRFSTRITLSSSTTLSGRIFSGNWVFILSSGRRVGIVTSNKPLAWSLRYRSACR